MLARLRGLQGIADARVECSGTFFVLSLTDQAERDVSGRAALEVLGPGSRELSSDEAGRQLEARRRGEIWFSEDQIRALSYVEARIVTNRALTSATQALSLTAAQTESTREAVQAEVFAAIDRVHDEGGRSSSGWFAQEWPHIVSRSRRRLEGTIPDATLEEIGDRLLREH